jgi:hypothetical protein
MILVVRKYCREVMQMNVETFKTGNRGFCGVEFILPFEARCWRR